MNTSQTESQKETRTDVDDLAERLRSSEEPKDDFAMVVANNWRRVVALLLLVLAGVWIVGEYRKAQEQKRGKASAHFEEVQKAYALLGQKTGEEKAVEETSAENKSEGDAGNNSVNDSLKNHKVFQENLTALTTSYSGSVYGKTVPLYRAAGAVKTEDYATAKKELETFDLGKFKSSKVAVGLPGKLEPEDVINELAMLLYCRTLLAEGKTPVETVNMYLENLTKRARVLNLEAALVMYRIASSETEKKRAISAAQSLSLMRPELADAVDAEFKQLGVVF